MRTQFRRFVATVLLFSILLQSCGNPNFRIVEPAVPKTKTPAHVAEQHTLLPSRNKPKEVNEETTALAESSPMIPSSKLSSTAPTQSTTDTSSQITDGASVAHSSTPPTNDVNTLATATRKTHSSLCNTATSPALTRRAALPIAANHSSHTSSATPVHNDPSNNAPLEALALNKVAQPNSKRAIDPLIIPFPYAYSLATAALSTTRPDTTAVVTRSPSIDLAIEAMKNASDSLTASTEQEIILRFPYAIVKGQQVRFQNQSGTWLAQVVDVWGRQQTLPVICSPAQTLVQSLQKLVTKAPSQHKYGIHILETDQAPWAPKVVYVGALSVRGGGNVVSRVARGVVRIARGFWGVVSLPFSAIAYACKDNIPRLPCRVTTRPKYDKDDLEDSKVDNSCKVGDRSVTFYESNGYWYARISRFNFNHTIIGDLCYDYLPDEISVPVKARHSVSASLEDLVNSRFSIHKYREKSFSGYMEYTFHDYNRYSNMGYELELITSPEQVQINKEARRSNRREARRREEERKRREEARRREEERKRQEEARRREEERRRQEEARRREEERRRQEEARRREEERRRQEEARRREEERRRQEEARRREELEQKKETERAALVDAVSEAAVSNFYNDLDQTHGLSEAHATQRNAMVQGLASRLAQVQSGTLEHGVVVDGYLSDEEPDYDLENSTGSGIDLQHTADPVPIWEPGEAIREEAKVPSSTEVLAKQLLHKHIGAYTLDKQVHSLQNDLHKVLQAASYSLTKWEDIASKDYTNPDVQSHLQDLHAKLLVLPGAFDDLDQRLQMWGQTLQDWADSIAMLDVQKENIENDYRALEHRYQTIKSALTDTQVQYQDLLQAVFSSHYYAALITPRLQKQAMSLAQSLVQRANKTTARQEHALQQAEQAYQKAQRHKEKVQGRLESAHNTWVRKQVAVMAHTLNHQPLLDYLAGKGCNYINEPDEQGKTALRHAIGCNEPNIVQWLLDHGADMEAKDTDGLTALHWAAKLNYANGMKILIKHGADVEVRDIVGCTPLHWAVRENSVEAVIALLEHGLEKEAKDEDDCTSLHYAVEAGNKAMSELLLRYGALPNVKDQWGITPLHRAALKGHLDIVELLLENSADIEATDIDRCTPLHFAVQESHTAVVVLLLNRGAKNGLAKNRNGLIPLQCAVQLGHTAVLAAFLDHGADVTATYEESCTLLHWASLEGHTETIKLLLDHGAAIEARNAAKQTPLHCAAQQGHVAAVELLLTRGANKEAQDKSGFTPLHWAAQQSHPIIAELLLIRGADPTAKDIHGKTPLTLAASQGHRLEDPKRQVTCKKVEDMAHDAHHQPLLAYLAGKGVQYINKTNAQDQTALICASIYNEPDIVQWLLDHGASLEAEDEDGFTALHWAVMLGCVNSINILVKHGADIEAKTKQGCTPLHLAGFQGHYAIVELLLNHGADATAQDIKKKSPLDIAEAKNHNAVATLLRTAQVSRQHTPISASSPLPSNIKDAPELVRAKEARNTAQALYQAAQQTADAAAQALQKAKTITEQTKNTSQASLRHLQTVQQHVAHLLKSTAEHNAQEPRCVAAYLQDMVKDTQDYLQNLVEQEDGVVATAQREQGNTLLALLYDWRKQEQENYRNTEYFFCYDATLSETIQAQLLGEALPQYQYHIDTLTDLIKQLVQAGHEVVMPNSVTPAAAAAPEIETATHATDSPHDTIISEQDTTVLLRIVQLSRSLPEALQENFKENIAPLLQQNLLQAPPSLQEEILHYFQKQGAFYPAVLQQHPAEDWIYMSLFQDLLKGVEVSEIDYVCFNTLVAKLKAQYPNDVLTAILWALYNKQERYGYSLEALCEVMEMLPEDGTQAQALLQLSNDQWYTALKATWLTSQIQAQCPTLSIAQRQHLVQELSHVDWSLHATQVLLEQLPPNFNPEGLNRMLAFVAQHDVDDTQLLEILTTPASLLTEDLIAYWHRQIACKLLKAKLSELLPQAWQESIYAMIEKLWVRTPVYQAIDTFLVQLLLNQLQQDSSPLDPEHLQAVLAMMCDYPLPDATYTMLLQQLADLPSQEWSQHFYSQIMQHCFAETSHERTVAEIIAYMAAHSPDVAYVQDQARLQQAHQNILKAYHSCSTLCPEANAISGWEADTVTKWAQAVKSYAKDPIRGTLPSQAELIAVVKRASELHHGFAPRDTQLLSLLVLLNPTPGQGRLLQKNTGEGKSLPVAMFAAIQALLNNKSDIVTTSTELSIPEVAKQRPFFEMLGLSVAENSAKGTQNADKKKQQAYLQDNVYGTAADFQGDILRTEFFGKEMRMQRPFERIVVDEVDNLLFDSRSHSIRLSSTMPATDHLTVLLAVIWQRVKHLSSHLIDDRGQIYYIEEDFHKDADGRITILSGEERDPEKCMIPIEGSVEDFITLGTQGHILSLLRTLTQDEKAAYAASKELERKIILQHAAIMHEKDPDKYKTEADKIEALEKAYQELPWNVDKEKYPPIVTVPAHLSALVKHQIPKWIQNAINAALVYKKEHHYNVHEGKIVSVDYNNTGVWQHNMVLSNGLTQFLQIKEGLKVSPEDISTNFISTVGFFQRYANQIYGLTGTLGNQTTQAFFKKVYNTDLVIIPPYKQRLIVGNEGSPYACKELTPQLITDKDTKKWYEAIENSTLQHVQQQRAVLIICKYIRQVHTLQERLKQRYTKDKIFIYTGKKKFEKDKVYPGEIIIATNIAGRGTDLTPSEMVEQHGGLHVCITFLPASYRVELQNAGRTARKGNRGTAQLILHQPEATSIEVLRQKRDIQEADALQKAIDEVERMTFKDALFQEFCKTENRLLPTLDGFARLRHSKLLTAAWESYAKETFTAEAVKDIYERHIDRHVQNALNSVPSSQWQHLSYAEKQAQKEHVIKKARIAHPYEEFQKEYTLRKRKEAIQELQTTLGNQALHPDIVAAFLEERKYVPENGQLAVKYDWGPYERKALEERFGLWFHTHMPQGQESVDFNSIRTAFDDFLEAIKADAEANKLVHNPYFYVQKGNDLLLWNWTNSAIEAYNRAIELDPDFSLHARHNKAMALLTPKKNKNEHTKAITELQEAKILLNQYKDRLLTFQTLVGHVQPPKPLTAQHLQHHLDILFQQENHIDAAIGVIKTAQSNENHVKVTKRVEIDALFDKNAAQEHPEQALAEVRKNGLSYFFTIEEKIPKPWLSICTVALIGIAQIAAAAIATISTAGLVTSELLKSGISDLMTTITSAISGKFSWKDWAISKVISVGISIISAGISNGWNTLKGSVGEFTASLKKGAIDLKDGVLNAKDAVLKQVKEAAWTIGKGVAHTYATVLIEQGVHESINEVLEEKITQAVSKDIMQYMLNSTLIQKAMAHDVAQGRDYWTQIFIREAIAMLNEEDSTLHTLILEITKGTAMQQLLKHIGDKFRETVSDGNGALYSKFGLTAMIMTELASLGLPMLEAVCKDMRGFTDTFLKQFHARLEQKYGQEIAKLAQKQEKVEEKEKVEEDETDTVDDIHDAEQEFTYMMDAPECFDEDELQLNDRYNGQAFSTQATASKQQQGTTDAKASQREQTEALGTVLTNNVSAQLLAKVHQRIIYPLASRAAGSLINYATSSITEGLREQRDNAVYTAQYGSFSNDHANQYAANQASNNNNTTSNTSSTMPQTPEAHNNHSDMVGDSNTQPNQQPSYREGNITDIGGYAANGIAIKIYKDGKCMGCVGTKNKSNGIIELEYTTNPNPSDNNHGHYQLRTKINGEVVDTTHDNNNGLCLPNAIFSGMTEAMRQKLNVQSGEDLYHKLEAHRLAHPTYTQQSDAYYQTILYRDPASLMQGAGVWADTATALKGIEKWLDAHPVLLSLTENIGNIVGGAAWLMTPNPAGVVAGLLVNCGYEMVLGLMESNIEVSTERLASYFKGHDADITDEQARYLADRSMKVLRTVGKAVIHQVAARGFSAGRAAVGRQADKVAGRAAKRVAKETREAKKVDLKPVKNAYKLAKEGKIHKKLYSENVNRPDKQLRKAIRSLQKGIDEHQDKIANPGNYYLDWDTFTKYRQQRQLIKWRREIKGFTEQKWIYEGILKNRKS